MESANKIMYRYIEPEVAGSFGENTQLDNSIHPPIVTKLHYEFKGWLGSDILETFPCYIVSERLKNEILGKKYSGVSFGEVEVILSEEFMYRYPEKKLPPFYWLKVIGQAGKKDFGIAKDFRLVISEAVFNSFNDFNVNAALFESFN